MNGFRLVDLHVLVIVDSARVAESAVLTVWCSLQGLMFRGRGGEM